MTETRTIRCPRCGASQEVPWLWPLSGMHVDIESRPDHSSVSLTHKCLQCKEISVVAEWLGGGRGKAVKKLMMRFEEGGCYTDHDDSLTLEDLQYAVGNLVCIILANLYRQGGPPAAVEWVGTLTDGAFTFYEELVMGQGVARETRIGEVERGE